jgi:hypothetical protein
MVPTSTVIAAIVRAAMAASEVVDVLFIWAKPGHWATQVFLGEVGRSAFGWLPHIFPFLTTTHWLAKET